MFKKNTHGLYDSTKSGKNVYYLKAMDQIRKNS